MYFQPEKAAALWRVKLQNSPYSFKKFLCKYNYYLSFLLFMVHFFKMVHIAQTKKVIVMSKKEEPKRPSLLQRLNAVIGTMDDFSRFPVVSGDNPSILPAQYLWDQYLRALSDYLKALNIPSLPESNPLRYPFAIFYKLKKDTPIRTIFYFPYGATRKSNLITPKTFPSFLVNVCGLPYKKNDPATKLFHCIDDLIRKYPYDRLEALTNLLKFYSPDLLYLIQSNPAFLAVSSNENLYYNLSCIPHNTFSSISSSLHYFPILALPIPNHMAPNVLKQYFSELLRRHRAQLPNRPVLSSVPEYPGCSNEVIYSNAANSALTSVRYLPEQDQFTQQPLPESLDCLNLKHVPLTISKTPDQVPSGALSALDTLCHTNRPLLDQFAAFLSAVASPTTGGLTVLLSPQNAHLLHAMLVHIFPSIHAGHSDKKQLFTLNQLSKKIHRPALYFRQACGETAIIVRDTLPSSANLPILRKLVKGKPVSIVTSHFPPQHHENRLHLICVTSDQKKAHLLQEQLKANVIDFSYSEKSISGPIPFTDTDWHWFRTTFLLHGLKYRTCQTQNIAFTAKPVEKESTHPDPLINFLQDYCSFQRDCFCNTAEVHACYIRFLTATQGISSPTIKPRAFNIQLRRKLTSLKGYQGVVYKRNHISRSMPSLWGYQGLKLPSELPTPPSSPANEYVLKEYLGQISKYQIHFSRIQEVHLVIPDRNHSDL